jgi:hypothetical protein
MTIPWALALLGPPIGRTVLVIEPTLLGVAWMVAEALATVDLCADVEPPGLAPMREARPAAVQWAGPLQNLVRAPIYDGGLWLAPASGPPATAALIELRRSFRAGGVLILAFRLGEEARLVLPKGWHVASGNPTVVPGLAQFDPRQSRAVRATAWDEGRGPIALLGFEPDS